jgi:sulfonate transport system substrate-binding protein
MKNLWLLFSKKINNNKYFLLITVLSFALTLTSFNITKAEENSKGLAIGYQTTWATAGQIMEAMVHISVPGSNTTFKPFTFGPEMNKAALDGKIDAITSGIVPTLSLLAASDEWISVCRLIDFPVSIVAGKGTGIKTWAGLKSKKVGVPFGAGAHLYLLQRLSENKLEIGTDTESVELVNVSFSEASNSLKDGKVDAVATWEPNTTIIEGNKIGNSFEDKRYIGFLTVRKNLVERNPKEVIALIKSMIKANFYVAGHRNQTDEWFSKRSNFDLNLVKKIRVIEPNLKAKNLRDISVQLKPADIKLFQEVADQMYQSKMIKSPVIISDRINLNLERQAVKELLKEKN